MRRIEAALDKCGARTDVRHLCPGMASRPYRDGGNLRYLSDWRRRYVGRIWQYFRPNWSPRDDVGGPLCFAGWRSAVCGRA